MNFNKNKHGIVSIYDNENINITINNSTFTNNSSKSYGGSLYVKKINNIIIITFY